MRLSTSFIALVALLLTTVLFAHGNKPGRAELNAGSGTITVDYVAPELKGRDIEAMLQQPGANPWRMGADRPTTLETAVPLRFGASDLSPGSYPLQAYRDDEERWWLQALDKARGVAGQFALEQSTAEDSEEHMVISLTRSGGTARFKLQWGTYVLSGDFSLLE